jgi:hypothetical protein
VYHLLLLTLVRIYVWKIIHNYSSEFDKMNYFVVKVKLR